MNWFIAIYGGLMVICAIHVFFSWRKDELFEAIYYGILGLVSLIVMIYEVVRSARQ